jgi:ACR3 family arsenite efflux pump ArsB
MEATEDQEDGEEKRLKAVDTSLTATTSKITHIDETVGIGNMTDTIPTVIGSLPTGTTSINIQMIVMILMIAMMCISI